MSPLAQVMRKQGFRVAGSDRRHDRGQSTALFQTLQRQGIDLFPQQGASMPTDCDVLITSTAIEGTSSEVAKARKNGIPVLHRADLLAELFNPVHGIGIAGTSGKSTVTGMVAAILDAAGENPTVINGGFIKNYASPDAPGNARCGAPDLFVAEIDESDGSIAKFTPSCGVVTNISKDHKEIDELMELFSAFAAHTSGSLALNGDCPHCRKLPASSPVSFGLGGHNHVRADAVRAEGFGSSFAVDGIRYAIGLPGIHNVYNALAALAVADIRGIDTAARRKGLSAFQGVKRRLDRVGTRAGVTVIDDFAHNPDKINASVGTLKAIGVRLCIIFQPHGFGPTRFMLNELAEAFSCALASTDMLIMLDIYDAGGTAVRTIKATDLLDAVAGPEKKYAASRDEAMREATRCVRPGDIIAVMGARDDTLSEFAARILSSL